MFSICCQHGTSITPRPVSTVFHVIDFSLKPGFELNCARTSSNTASKTCEDILFRLLSFVSASLALQSLEIASNWLYLYANSTIKNIISRFLFNSDLWNSEGGGKIHWLAFLFMFIEQFILAVWFSTQLNIQIFENSDSFGSQAGLCCLT